MAKGIGNVFGILGPHPKGPAGNIPAGGPRSKKKAPGGFMVSPPISRNKKGRAGSRAGLRGSPRSPQLTSINTAKIPKGPSPFASVQLPKRGAAAATKAAPAPAPKKPSLLNRIFSKVRGK